MQPTAQAVGERPTEKEQAPEGAKEKEENSPRRPNTVEACRDPSLRLFFALIAQRPILTQDDKSIGNHLSAG